MASCRCLLNAYISLGTWFWRGRLRAVFALGVVAPGLNSRSIVWGQQEGKWQPLIVDGFGDPNVIKLRSWVPYLRHRALHRGMERTARDVGLHWSRRKKMFLRNDYDALN